MNTTTIKLKKADGWKEITFQKLSNYSNTAVNYRPNDIKPTADAPGHMLQFTQGLNIEDFTDANGVSKMWFNAQHGDVTLVVSK